MNAAPLSAPTDKPVALRVADYLSIVSTASSCNAKELPPHLSRRSRQLAPGGVASALSRNPPAGTPHGAIPQSQLLAGLQLPRECLRSPLGGQEMAYLSHANAPKEPGR